MRVNILCPDGVHYVRTFRDGILDAVATVPDVWELFHMETLVDGTVAFRTHHTHPQASQYVRAVAGGGGSLIADRNTIQAHEKFSLVTIPGNRVAIQSHNGNFWRAKNQGGGILDVNATNRSTWEIFRIVAAA